MLIEKSQYSKVLVDSLDILNITKEQPFGYMEFGCGVGDTTITASEVFRGYNTEYVAFDSFLGLPSSAEQESNGLFKTGQFSTTKDAFLQNLKSNAFPLERLTVFSGWFNEVLPLCLANKSVPEQDYRIFLFDCDLYSSTKSALEFLLEIVKNECIIVFDDWYSSCSKCKESGQRNAFYEFLRKNVKTVFAEAIGEYEYYGTTAGKCYWLKKYDC